MTLVLQELTSLFGMIVLLSLMAAGLVTMFSPQHGRELLKNALVALGLFVIGTTLVQASCTAIWSAR